MERPRARRRGFVPMQGTAAPAAPGLERGDSLHRWMRVTVCLLGAAALPGCAGYYYGEKYGSTLGATLGAMLRPNLVEASHRATDALMKNVALDPAQPVLVATLVDVDRRAESSRWGRIVAEQIAGRMVQRGLRVTEPKLWQTLAVQRDQSELLPPPELREAGPADGAQAVVVGTYAVSPSQLYISLKLVNPSGNAVLAAHDYAVPMDDDVRALLAGK